MHWNKHQDFDLWFFENGQFHVAGSVELRDGKYVADISTGLYEDEDGLEVDCRIVGTFDDLEAAKRAVEKNATQTTQGESIS